MTPEAKQTETITCPFPECDWSHDYDPDEFHDELTADHRAEMHYEREHAGKVEVQVTLEKTEQLGGRDPEAIRERVFDRPWMGYDVAHVRTKVLDEADDHSVLEDPDDE